MDCRLNSLPDPIKNHIVASLPIEDAAKTSLLSRQWRHVFSSLPYVNIDHSKYQHGRKQICFPDLVHHSLLNHDMSNIISFNLAVSVDFRDKKYFNVAYLDVNAWVTFALRHNVQHIFVKILSARLEQLPCGIFSCSSLQFLSLDNMKLHLSSAISLPKLKKLKFFDVHFHSENFTMKLLPNCPILEDLILQNCNVYSLDDGHPIQLHFLTISAPTLEILILHCDSLYLKVSISAPRLQLIKCLLPRRVSISPETLSSLVRAEFDFSHPGSCLTNIVLGLSNVQTLCLSHSCMSRLFKNQNSSAGCPTFNFGFRHLQLEMYPSDDQVKVLLLLLRGSTNLQSLNIYFRGTTNIINLDTEQSEELCFEYALMHLKKIEIKNFVPGMKYELDIVRLFLEKAMVLEEMNIHYSVNIKYKMELHRLISGKLLTFTKICPHAKVVFL